MIRINLLKNRIIDTVQVAAAPGSGSAPTFGASDDTREAVVKGFVIVIFTACIIMYETQNIRGLSAQVQSLAVQGAELDEKAAAIAKDVEAIKDIENQARELEDKLKILKLLSKLRLREVKTLDFVQSAIPEKVWLKGLTYEADKDRVEFGRFSFTGNAAATEDLTEFVRRLEDSAYLYEVIVMKNQEFSPNPSLKAVIRDFLFTAQVEVRP